MRESGWRGRLALNGFGAVLTGVVAVVVTVAKAPTSLLVAIVIPILVLMMLFIHRQYRASSERLAVPDQGVLPGPSREERAVVPVPGINRAVVNAVNVARSIASDVRAVYVADDAEEGARMRDRWVRQLPDVPLVVVESPYRALVGPLLSYLDVLAAAWPPDKPEPITFVVIPEYVARSWWERMLYNQSAKRLEERPDWPTAHGGRRRPLPARRIAGRTADTRASAGDASRHGTWCLTSPWRHLDRKINA